MKPHPRIRKTIKWGGAAVTVLLVVVWAASEWRGVQWVSGAHTVFFVRGLFVESREIGEDEGFPLSPPDLPNGWYVAKPPDDPARVWWPDSRRNLVQRTTRVPIWVAMVPAALITALAVCLDSLARRRAMLNLCPKCNYDRAGIAAGAVCPECGAAAPASSA